MEEKKEVRKVKTKWVITIQPGSKVLVKSGDEVNEGQKLIEMKMVTEKVVSLTADYDRLSNNDWDQLKTKLIGLEVVKGQNIFGNGNEYNKNPISVVSGKIVKVDEFKNVYIQSIDEEVKIVSSPVKAKVIKIDDETLTLEFRAEEYPGEGVTEGKVWASGGLKFVEKLADISVKDSGRIILVDELNQAMLIKAGVVGIKGVVVMDSGVHSETVKYVSDLPILKVNGDSFFRLRKFGVDEDSRMLLNASGGRLLLCQK
jgi:hypothetical protein